MNPIREAELLMTRRQLFGRSALGVGTELIPTEALKRKQAKRIQELALRFREFVKEARARITPPSSATPEKGSAR